mmetsp:Transcript_146283/g.469201  ORF Transcript_146283/g.469201 Transcript_146283/m.469201 type:complete len:245 (+) Transcript_146283:325-1059(+)
MPAVPQAASILASLRSATCTSWTRPASLATTTAFLSSSAVEAARSTSRACSLASSVARAAFTSAVSSTGGGLFGMVIITSCQPSRLAPQPPRPFRWPSSSFDFSSLPPWPLPPPPPPPWLCSPEKPACCFSRCLRARSSRFFASYSALGSHPSSRFPLLFSAEEGRGPFSREEAVAPAPSGLSPLPPLLRFPRPVEEAPPLAPDLPASCRAADVSSVSKSAGLAGGHWTATGRASELCFCSASF